MHRFVAIICITALVAGCARKDGAPTGVADPRVSAARVAPWTQEGPLPSHGLCSLDSVNEAAPSETPSRVAAGQAAVLRGWLTSPTLSAPGPMHVVLLDPGTSRGWQFAGTTGLPRPDVVRAVRSEAASTAGFEVVLPSGQIPAGRYAVRLVVTYKGNRYACETGRQVQFG